MVIGRREGRLTTVWESDLSDHVIDLAWSPDGRYMAAASVSGPIGVYDSVSGEQVWLFKGHSLGTMSLAWHPKSHLLATGGQDGKVRLWDVLNGQEMTVLDPGTAWVEKVAWSGLDKDRQSVLATTAGRTLRFWSESGDLLREFNDAPSTLTDMAWKPGKKVLAVTAYGGARLYHPNHAKPDAVLPWQGSSLVVAWSPNGKMLATGDQDSTVHFWYVREARDLQMWGYQTKVRELAWDRSSRYLATGGGVNVTIWDCGLRNGPAGSRPKVLKGHKDFLTVLAYQRKGDRLLSAGQDGQLIVWEPKKGKRPLAVQPFSAAISTAAWSPDEQQIIVGLDTGLLACVAM